MTSSVSTSQTTTTWLWTPSGKTKDQRMGKTKILSLQDEVERPGEHPGPGRHRAPGQPDRLGLQPQPRRQGPLPPLGQEEEQSYLDTQYLWPGQCRDLY